MLRNLYNNTIKIKYENTAPFKEIPVYHIILIIINNDFKKRLIDVYNKNS